MLSTSVRRWILAATVLLVGLLQSWDSDVFEAGPLQWILTGAGILVAASAALIAEGRHAVLVAVPLSAGLFLAARWLSETPLPGILVISVAAGALLLINDYIERREEREAGGERPPAR